MSATEVDIGVLNTDRFEDVVSPEVWQAFQGAIEHARRLFDGRVIWNVNSTARGGGVAEMLTSLLGYARGAGVDARWLVIPGDADFFRITKRIHNHLHGAPGDGGTLGEEERGIYDRTLAPVAEDIAQRVRDVDLVIVHDPQPAGLIEALKGVAGGVVWRCHVGLDLPNDLARGAWRFLIPYVEKADAYIFSRRAYAWEGLTDGKLRIIPPSIDAFSPKNEELDLATVDAILDAAGAVEGATEHPPTFHRLDGSPSRVDRRVEFADKGAPPRVTDRIVTQVSRWDRLKDPAGVIEGFARYVLPRDGAHLIVAGPAVAAVSDDPEGAEVLNECLELWRTLEPLQRERIHLACLPMDDSEENAAIVNALQRRSDVVVQKSIAEGFGLTVAEAMWKGRPVVASRIGGIQDQIVHDESGMLLHDARDLEAYGRAVASLLEDPERARRIGEAARARVREHFLGPRHLMQYVELFAQLLA